MSESTNKSGNSITWYCGNLDWSAVLSEGKSVVVTKVNPFFKWLFGLEKPLLGSRVGGGKMLFGMRAKEARMDGVSLAHGA
jgi:hypothetical protein